MSTRAEEVSIQALSPELTVSAVLGAAGLAAAAGAGDGPGDSSAARKSEAAPETQNMIATNKTDRPNLAGVIAPFTFQN